MVLLLMLSWACAEPEIAVDGEIDEDALEAWLAEERASSSELDLGRVEAAGGEVYWGEVRLLRQWYITEADGGESRSGGDVSYEPCWGHFWVGVLADGTVRGQAECGHHGSTLHSGPLRGRGAAGSLVGAWDVGGLVVGLSGAYDGAQLAGSLGAYDGWAYYDGGVSGVRR